MPTENTDWFVKALITLIIELSFYNQSVGIPLKRRDQVFLP